MPGRKKSVAAEINDLVSDLPHESRFSECTQNGRSYNYRVEAARKCLSSLAGGEDEVIGLMLAILSKREKMEVWKLLSGKFPDEFEKLAVGVKRLIINGLGWSHSMFGMAGLKVGEELFASREGCGKPGRPKKITEEQEKKVEEVLNLQQPSFAGH